MKITLFIGGISGGGAERVVCNLANYLCNKGHCIKILTISEDESSYELNERIQVVSLLKKEEKRNVLLNAIKRAYRMIKVLRTNDADTYVVFLPITIILLLSFRIFTKARIIASERCQPSALKGSIQYLLKKLCNKADAWVFQTIQQKEWYSDYLGKTKYCIIPNAINEIFLHRDENIAKKDVIITSGRLGYQKNHKLLISAFSKIANKYPSFEVHIYGKGGLYDELSKQIQQLGLSDRILLKGHTNRLKECLEESKLFVLPSIYEGIPNALMEAMALGIPSISTDCDGGGARFLIKDGQNGVLVPKNDADAMASAIDKVLSNKEFADILGFEAHKLCENLAPEKVYGMWEHFIEDVVNEK